MSSKGAGRLPAAKGRARSVPENNRVKSTSPRATESKAAPNPATARIAENSEAVCDQDHTWSTSVAENYLYSFVYPSQSVELPRLRQRYAVLRKIFLCPIGGAGVNPGRTGTPAGKAAPIFGGVLTISITAEALAAIVETLPDAGRPTVAQRGKAAISSPCRMWSIGSNYLREPGQSFSDVILRLATAQ
jgi:hypothetical protein